MNPVIGLALSGGGARSAYQVGALRAIAEVAGSANPFPVVTGVSGGAINAAAIATGADDFADAVARLEAVWRGLSANSVYRTDLRSLAGIGARWLLQLGGGGLLGRDHVNALLDTSPLRALLERQLPMARIPEHVASGRLRGAAVTATSYHSGTAITFYEGTPDIEPWARMGRLGQRSRLTTDHVLASAAIPLFFPPVRVGHADYGDGCIRLTAPLSPAIHLGAERMVAIGVRYARSPEETLAINGASGPSPTPAEIGGVLLNAVFLDSLETDAERLLRINRTLSLMNAEQRARLPQPLRRIPMLLLRPSVDLGMLAVEQYRELPRALRYLLRGIGADHQRGWDLISYLAFEPVYVDMLIELGYADTRARRAEIETFLGAEAVAA